jgi:glycosyltransferase involved in cell wall biosynthesis
VKIAVVELAGTGGLIHYAYQLCRAMRREGADVTLVTDHHYELESLPHAFDVHRVSHLWNPKPEDGAEGRPVLRRAFRAAKYYREWARVTKHLKTLGADVVQFGDIRFATDLVPLRAAARTARLAADICHNVRPFSARGSFGTSRFGNALYRRIYRQFDVVFVHYDVNREAFTRAFPDVNVVKIVHGNQELFRELAKPTDLGIEGPVVLFFGTIAPYKGIDVLLEAFEKVDNATLVIAGFPLQGVPETRNPRVKIVPRYIPIEEVGSWMQLADVIVLPYRDIFQSGALHLAQTFGVPIVATQVGATAEVIRDRETGLLVEPNDAGALAAAINELLANRTFARSLGDAAARDAETRFSWRGVARTILSTYEALL